VLKDRARSSPLVCWQRSGLDPRVEPEDDEVGTQSSGQKGLAAETLLAGTSAIAEFFLVNSIVILGLDPRIQARTVERHRGDGLVTA